MNNFNRTILILLFSFFGCLAKPTAKIILQDTSYRYYANSVLTLTGIATDPTDGTLTGSSFRWFQDYRHEDHWHDDASPFASGSTRAVYHFPPTSDLSTRVFRRIILIVTNSLNQSDTTYVDIYPKLVHITLNTFPDSLQIGIAGSLSNGNITYSAVQGTIFSLTVFTSQFVNGNNYTFQKWSNGNTYSTSSFYIPERDTCLLAVFSNDQLTALPDHKISSTISIGPIISLDNTISGVNQTVIGLNTIVFDSTFTNKYPYTTVIAGLTVSGLIADINSYNTTLNSKNFNCNTSEIVSSNITLSSGISTSNEAGLRLLTETLTITSSVSTVLGNSWKETKVVTIITATTTTGATLIKNIVEEVSILITNPVEDQIICWFGHEVELKGFSLSNLLGSEMSAKRDIVSIKELRIPINNFQPGVYLLVIHFDNVVKSFKIIKS